MIAVRVNGDDLSLGEVLSLAKFQGRLEFIEQAITAVLVRQAAERMGFEVTDEELQQAADAFRLGRKLYQADATHAWLAANHLQQEDWEAVLEDEILERKVKDKICQGKIDQSFVENRRALDAASISQILVADENVARELRAQVVDDQVNFFEIAQRYPAGRWSGRLRRRDMEPLLAAAVFSVRDGELAGPVRTNAGWNLALVEALHPATLDGDTREDLANMLFAQWLEAERRKASIDLPLLTEA